MKLIIFIINANKKEDSKKGIKKKPMWLETWILNNKNYRALQRSMDMPFLFRNNWSEAQGRIINLV
jgi:hypothetical protein